MITDTDNLREKRLSFYSEQIDPINVLLHECVELSDGTCSFLIDKDGYMVTKAGTANDVDLQGVAALVAGSYAATHAMAKILGEDGFSILFSQGRQGNMLLSLVGERAILATLFDDRSTLGVVRLYATQVAEKLEEILNSIERSRSSANNS